MALGNGGSENLGVGGRAEGRGDIEGASPFAFGGNGRTFENLDLPLASSPLGV